MYQVMADWGHPASLPSPLDMIYLPPHLPRIFNHGRRFPPGGGGEYSWEFLVGVCRKVLQILTRFQTKKCNFPHPFSD